jgi:argininosuccinate lyase
VSLIWDKGGSAVDERVQRFCAAEDAILDRELLRYDILASKAHVRGLGRIDVLEAGEVDDLIRELDALDDAFVTGAFILDDSHEDGHSAIEAWLTDRLGDAGKKVHTGRSRNDQVQVALRLYMRAACEELAAVTQDTASALLDRAETDADAPMPGYTHLQRAMPSSVGHWLGGHAETFVDDRDLARSTAAWIDSCPLGTAAGYGVNLPLDREGVAEELGFARLQLNPQAVQNSRGKFELQVLTALSQALLDVRRFAWDLSLFTTAEFGFVTLPARYTTGSSIMPNKRNPDVVELLRGAYGVVQGATTEIQSILSLPSGYQRDLQNTKPALIRALRHGLAAVALVPDIVQGMILHKDTMRAAISPEMFATDRAVELTADGVPFRDAYRQVAAELNDLDGRSPEASNAARVSLGAPGQLGLDRLRARLRS